MVPVASTPPFAGLLAGLRLALGTGERDADIAAINGIADWNAIARLAKAHRIGALMWRGAHAAGSPIPDADAALEPLRDQAIRRGLRQLAGLRQATELLAENGIPSLVLKGLPLGVHLFRTPLARHCFDIDLLIPPDAVPEAGRALSRGGWNLLKPSFRPTPARERFYDRFVKDRMFIGPGGALELHHRLFSNSLLLQASFERLRANAATVEVAGRAYDVLGDDDLLVYLAVHGQLHRWSRLKWICDVAALLASIGGQRFIAAIERCRRLQLKPETVFGPAILLSRESFHVDLPPGAAPLLSGARTRRAADLAKRLWNEPRGPRGLQGAARRVDEMRMSLAMRPGWRNLKHELARLFMAPHDLGSVNLPDRLLFLYVPLRPVLWIARRFRLAGNRSRPRSGPGRLSGARQEQHNTGDKS